MRVLLPALYLLAACCACAPAAGEADGLKPRLEQMLKSGDLAGIAAQADAIPKSPPAERPALLRLLATAYEGTGDPAKAADALLLALSDTQPSLEDITTLKRLGRACIAAHDPAAGARVLSYALAQYPGALDRYVAGKPTGYSYNRVALDRAAGCVELASALAQADAAAGLAGLRPEVAQIARQFPDAPGAQPLLVLLAGELQAAGDGRGAIVMLLRVLTATGDRTRPHKTKLPDNQAYLDAISTAHSAELLAQALGILRSACEQLGTGPALDVARLGHLADLWHRAEAAAYSAVRTDEWSTSTAALAPAADEAPREPPLPRWEAVTTACQGTPLSPLAHLTLGQWLQYRGLYAQAEAQYRAADEEADLLPGLDDWLAFERGELAIQTGRIAGALDHFQRCRGAGDGALAAEAALRAAECYEFLGQWAAAREANQRTIEQRDYLPAVRERAELALQRIDDARSRVADNGDPAPAAYAGQDRQTQGDWQWRAKDQFVVCVGSSDLCGGAGPPWQYTLSTTDPARHIYWWHGGDDPDPSMPYDPTRDARGPRNWDDGGEKYPPATGPDLLVDLPVPAGAHNLGLYFVNDRNYYEPNRLYTVHLTDAATGTFFAAAPVRGFCSGVYVLFCVTGPRTVRARIWRNLSMNTLLTGLFLNGTASVPDWATLTEGRADLAAAADDWEAFRTAWREGADGPTQRVLLSAVCRDVSSALGQREAGRALQCLAGKLAEQGLEAASMVIEDGALAPLSRGSQRQYAATLADAVMAFGGPRAMYYVRSRRREGAGVPRAIHPAYATAKARDYAALMRVPSSLVAPEDVVQLARGLERQPGLSAVCYRLAVGGDLAKLPSRDLWDYAYSLRDDEARIQVYTSLLARDGPLPRPRASLRADLVGAYTGAGRLDEAEAQMEALMSEPDSDETKGYAACSLATACKMLHDPSRARRWAERIVKDLPGSSMAPRAQRLLSESAEAGPAGPRRSQPEVK